MRKLGAVGKPRLLHKPGGWNRSSCLRLLKASGGMEAFE